MAGVRHIFVRFGRLVAYVGLVAWALGTAVALVIGDAQYVQRFGALGVAASVLFFSDRITQIELGRQRAVEKLLHEYGLELSALRRGVDPRDIPIDGYAVDFLTEERHFGELRQRADLTNFANVMLITVATLQWGFGDHLVERVTGCGVVPC